MLTTEGAADRAVGKLQTLVRIPTVSYRDWDTIDTASFDGFVEELRAQFPLLHAHLELTRIHTHGLLFHWRGRSAERPVVLMAHLDVVPVEGEWQHGAFSGDIADGQIWGRGTLDDKGALVAVAEAVEVLLERGHVPAQDVWLSFGCDEEVFGKAAPMAVEELRSRGVRPWIVVDEGGAIAGDAFPGISKPIGVIGVTEKGVTSLELTVEGRGGHASTPGQLGPTARLARAITRLDNAADAGQRPGADAGAVPPARTARPARDAPAPRRRRPGRARAGPTLVLAGPEPGGDGPHHVRGHHALGLARAQRDRPEGASPGSTSGSWSATPSRRSLEHVRTAIGDNEVGSTSSRPTSRARSRRYDPTRLPAPHRDHHRGLPGRRARAVRDDGRHRRTQLHRDLRPGLPLRAVPDDQAQRQAIHSLRRAYRGRRLRRGRPLVPAPDREDPR